MQHFVLSFICIPICFLFDFLQYSIGFSHGMIISISLWHGMIVDNGVSVAILFVEGFVGSTQLFLRCCFHHSIYSNTHFNTSVRYLLVLIRLRLRMRTFSSTF
uniref:Uncharacterized protein n=1 Tax=Cacopsylla melanoneura TaxID=428564 RepID=A0A8D8M777_9HEMI